MALVVSQLTLLDWLAAHPVRACEPTPEPATALDGLTRTVGGTTYTLRPWGPGLNAGRERLWVEAPGFYQSGARTWPRPEQGWCWCVPTLPWLPRAPWDGGQADTREAAEAAADAALRERLALAPAPLARTDA